METKNKWKGILFGGVAASTAEIVTFPIDLVKTRMQLQGELGKSAIYRNSFHAALRIVQTEGAFALYKGLSPSLLRQVTYGSLRYGLYAPIRQCVEDFSRHKNVSNFLIKVASGAFAGALSSCICNPADLIKVRMQAATNTVYTGIGHACSTIIRQEGMIGLWRGLGPTCARATSLAAAELATYDEMTQWLNKNQLLSNENGPVRHFSAAIVAGFAGAWVSSPFDVVKSRMMNQPVDMFGRGQNYRSMKVCFVKTVETEGITSLWKGFWPSFGRIGPRVCIIFMAMEQMRALFD